MSVRSTRTYIGILAAALVLTLLWTFTQEGYLRSAERAEVFRLAKQVDQALNSSAEVIPISSLSNVPLKGSISENGAYGSRIEVSWSIRLEPHSVVLTVSGQDGGVRK